VKTPHDCKKNGDKNHTIDIISKGRTWNENRARRERIWVGVSNGDIHAAEG